jgi:predicted nucleic acid-binding protein
MDVLADEQSALVLVPLDEAVARAVGQIPRDKVPDMPDRIIAATALHLNLPLITRDRQIQTAKIPTIW